MASRGFTYYAFDAVSRTLRDELPLSSYEWTDTLNRPGSMAARLSRTHAKATRANLEPGATILYVDRGGLLLFGGIIWAAQSGSRDPLVRLGGQGLFSYYRDGRRFIRSRTGMTYATGTPPIEITFTAIDAFRVVKDLIDHAATFAGTIGFDAVRFHGPGAAGISGLAKTRTYWAYELKGIGQAIEELASQSPGFDFSTSVAWDPATSRPLHYLDLFYPRRGVASGGPTFIAGKNIELLDWTRNAAAMGNVVTATGAGQADAMLTSESADLALIGAYPRLEKVTSYRDESLQANLDAHATADLSAAKAPIETVRARVTETVDSLLTAFDAGDTATFQADDGFLNIDADYRITTKKVSVDANGHPSIEITAGDEAASLGVA